MNAVICSCARQQLLRLLWWVQDWWHIVQGHRQTCSSSQQHRGQIGLESREYGVKNAVCAVGGLKRGNWHWKGGMCRRKMMTNEQAWGVWFLRKKAALQQGHWQAQSCLQQCFSYSLPLGNRTCNFFPTFQQKHSQNSRTDDNLSNNVLQYFIRQS